MLLRNKLKKYVVQNMTLVRVKDLTELKKKYAGRRIYDVSDTVIKGLKVKN